MKQGSPQTEIDSTAADAVFGQIDTVIIPTESGQQTEGSQRHEKVEQQNIQAQAESMMKRTVTALKKLCGYDEQNRRMRSPRRSLGGVQNLEARMLMSGTPAEIRMIDANGVYVLQQETVTEAKKIDFSTLAQGVKPEMWTTTIEGLGQVTMWFQGGTRVDNQGISAVQQPLGGTGFWFKFDNASVKLLSVELEKEAPTQGFLRIVKDNAYVRENGIVKDFNFAPTINFQGDLVDRIDGGQNSGRVGLRSITVGVQVTRETKKYLEPERTSVPPTPNQTTQQETVTESRTIDFSTLAQGVKPEMWTTTIESLGQVTMWFQGGTIVDSQGISAVQQPLDGTGFWFRFDNSSVKLLSVELEKEAATQGFLRIVKDNDYIRENGTIKNFDFAPTINFQGDLVDRIDGGQNSGRVTLKSITVEVTVTRDVQVTDADTTEETLATTIDSLEAPWSLGGQTNRIAALTERALALQQAAKDLSSIADTLDPETAEQMASTLLGLIEDYVTIERQVFAEGLESLSPTMQAQLQQNMEELQLVASEIDLTSPTRSHSDTSRVIDTFQVPELGGVISVHGLQGSSISALQQTSQTIEGTGVITETGRALALDFGALTSPVLRASFTVTSSQPTDQLRVSFLKDSGVLEEQLVSSGDVVSYENLAGITGVMIENVTDILSEDAKAYIEYRRTYRSNYLYEWQDPGPRHHFFGSVRPDLANRESAIVAEALRGEVSHPVSLKDLSVTTNLSETKDVSALSVETNGLYATMALPTMTTFPFPYGGFGGITQVNYDPHSYNVYNLKVFGGAPEIEGVSYVDASGQNRALSSEFYRIDGNSITVFPTGQNLTIGIRVKNGTGYSPSLPVGQNYDYEVLTKSGPSMAEALPSPEARISVDAISLMTMNQGPSAGWHSGAALQYDTGSPVAVGTLKAKAQITNTGGSAAGFTVKVYSGNAGVNGWDTLQYSYQGTLAGGESRSLVTPFTPMVDSEGRSFVRFVVVGHDGRILMEGGRTVGAAGGVMTAEGNRAKFLDFMKNWTSAMQQAQSETVAYFVGRGETAPTMGNAAAMAEQIVATNTDTSQMPDPAMTERLLRIAMRSLVSAQESGDSQRMAMEQTRFNDAVSAHNAARSVAMATPNGDTVASVSAILEKEQSNSNLHGAALAKANGGLMEQTYKILVASKNVDENFVGPQIPSSGSKQLTLTNGGSRITPETLVMLPQSTIERTIQINQKTMANFWVDGTSLASINGMIFQRNFSLSISGNNLDTTYTSDRANTSGESISLVLQPGEYTITVRDHTNYGNTPPQTTFSPSLEMNVQRFNSAEIVGRVSIESSNLTMPVSMKVAEFYTDENNQVKRKTDYNLDPNNGGVGKLDSSKPVLVMVHGMDDDETGAMERAAKVLKEYPGMQVVTIGWKEAADATLKSGNDAPWTKGVGAWAGSQLIGLGFDPANINVVGHSHGTYVGYAMAQQVMSEKQGAQINAFVALDPAGNVPLVSGFTVGDMNFSSVSRNSIAIEGSLGAGNNALAGTADLAFQIDSPGGTFTPLSEHSLPVETFISLMHLGRLSPISVPENLRLDRILTPIDQQTVDLQRNVFRGYYEGIITIDTRTAFDAYDKKYLFALPKSITTRHNGDVHDDIDLFPPADSIFA